MSAADANPQTALLNGREIAIEAGETILDAARRLRIEIPTLCHDDRVKPVGGCRLCLVHCEGRNRPVAACHTELEPGMDIETHHPEVEDLRRSLLELYFETSNQTGFDTQATGDGQFAELVKRYQPEVAAPTVKTPAVSQDRSHPILLYTASACVGCRLCLSACTELQNESVFALDGRGVQAGVKVAGEGGLGQSPCVACGACVDLCPTGALSDRDRRRPLGDEVRMTDTVCGFCSLGCGIEVAAEEGVIRRITGIPDALPNLGHLCEKGRYGHASNGSWERITKPMLRDGAGFREVDWGEAITFISEKIAEIVNAQGPDAFGAIASPQSTNEANYLLQKFCRTIIRTNNIDSAARFSHLTSAMAMYAANGYGGGMVSFDTIEKAHCFVIAGADLTVSHPVLGARIRRAVTKGARLIVIDPRATELAQEADLFIQLLPRTDATLLNGLAHELVENRMVNLAVTATCAEGATHLRGFLSRYPLKKVAGHCCVPVEVLSVLSESLSEFGERSLFLYGKGLTQQGNGTEAVNAFYNLAVLCGAVGNEKGGGFTTPGGQANLQGTVDTGCLPEWLPGHRPADDHYVWPHFQTQWGVAPPENPGLNCRQMLEAARSGELSALWVMGRELVENQPDKAAAEEALKSLSLLVVQDLSYSEQCRHADVILPSATFYEQDGTLTNGERRVQLIRQAVEPPGGVLPDWMAITRVARRLGAEWPYPDAAQVFSEITRVVPDLMGGLSHERLEDEPAGPQWPCPSPEHPGTRSLRFEDLPDGRTRLFTEFHTPYPELATPGYPFLLVTGRQRETFRGGPMNGPNPSPAQSEVVSIEIHPSDAKRYGVSGGKKVTVESPSGEIEAVAYLSDAILSGTVFLTGRSPRGHASRLAGDTVDPVSGCPALNGISVRLAPATKEEEGK